MEEKKKYRRGENPVSLEQLKKGHPFNSETGKAAAMKSQEVQAANRQERKTILKWVEYFGDKPIDIKNPDGSVEKVVTMAAVGQALLKKASSGDIRAIELLLKLKGELEENINIEVTKPKIVFGDDDD